MIPRQDRTSALIGIAIVLVGIVLAFRYGREQGPVDAYGKPVEVVRRG